MFLQKTSLFSTLEDSEALFYFLTPVFSYALQQYNQKQTSIELYSVQVKSQIAGVFVVSLTTVCMKANSRESVGGRRQRLGSQHVAREDGNTHMV